MGNGADVEVDKVSLVEIMCRLGCQSSIIMDREIWKKKVADFG